MGCDIWEFVTLSSLAFLSSEQHLMHNPPSYPEREASNNRGEIKTSQVGMVQWLENWPNLVHTEMMPNAEYMIKEVWPQYLAEDYCTKMTFDITPRATSNHTLSLLLVQDLHQSK
jgi:hypothetical protein